MMTSGGRILRGASCRSPARLRGMLRAGALLVTPSTTPAEAQNCGLPSGLAEANAFSEAARSCQEPRRLLPFVSRSSLGASVLSGALFGEGWAMSDAPGCPTIDATDLGRSLALPQNQQLRTCDSNTRACVRSRPVGSATLCGFFREVPHPSLRALHGEHGSPAQYERAAGRRRHLSDGRPERPRHLPRSPDPWFEPHERDARLFSRLVLRPPARPCCATRPSASRGRTPIRPSTSRRGSR